MTSGQRLALDQLEEIQRVSGAAKKFEILSVKESENSLVVEISIFCGDLPKTADGLPLRQREIFLITIAQDFPFDIPSIDAPHNRFAGFPHVQWACHLCLYQAPGTEWNANDGMFGFVERLEYWLKQGAINQLDPPGAPIHPPVAYTSSKVMVIPRTDAPPVGDRPWLGMAGLKIYSEVRIDITGWSPIFDEATPANVAPAILMPQPMPFEYPKKASLLFQELINRGVSRRDLLLHLQVAILNNPANAPLFIVIGAAQRGIAGSGIYKQHLQVWHLEPTSLGLDVLRLSLEKYSDNPKLQEIGERCEELLWKWIEIATVSWCAVREARPEIITRRDQSSPPAWFKNRTVAVWGCGALGCYLAEFVARAGAKKIILRDNSKVAPGLLVRQPFYDEDIGKYKAQVLAERLKKISPDLEVISYVENILKNFEQEDWIDSADIILDASASEVVRQKAEISRRSVFPNKIPIASFVINHDAQRALCVLAGPDWSGGVYDAMRKAKVKACDNDSLRAYLEDFWPNSPQRIFQPEPGCSDPTFTGSSADVATLAGTMLNCVAVDLSKNQNDRAFFHFLTQPSAAGFSAPFHGDVSKDLVCQEADSKYEIRVNSGAWQQALNLSRSTPKKWGRHAETGGLLFGEKNEPLGVIWIDEIAGPPRDSKASPSYFFCGTEGTQDLNKSKEKKYRSTVSYIGLWHSHPDSLPLPSDTDIRGVGQVLSESANQLTRLLFMIIGTVTSSPVIGAYAVRLSEYEQWKDLYQNRTATCHFIIETYVRRKGELRSGKKAGWRWPRALGWWK